MDQSAFMEPGQAPGDQELLQALGSNYVGWKDILDYVLEACPKAKVSWHYSRSGWNCRISDAKRVIIYLMPCTGYFNASFVLGQKAVAVALSSSIHESFKQIIGAAKPYAEGTGFRLPVKTRRVIPDLQILVKLKLG